MSSLYTGEMFLICNFIPNCRLDALSNIEACANKNSVLNASNFWLFRHVKHLRTLPGHSNEVIEL